MKQIIIFALLLALAVGVRAKTTSLPALLDNSEVRKIQSKILGEEYNLKIHLPDNYDKSKKFPVVYILDGEDAFPFATEYLKLIRSECETPEPILVGISDGTKIGEKGNKRSRDYTPTVSKVSWAQGEGGAAKFLDFIEKEAVPLIERNYSVSTERALYGHSYGGLFGTYALLHKPELFQKIMLGSPSLFYDNEVLFKDEAGFAQTHKDLAVQLFLTAGTEEDWAVEGNDKFAAVLKTRNYPSLKIDSIKIQGVGHLTGSPISQMLSLKWAFCKK